MKFGKTITSHQVPEWSHHYMNYKDLKKLIKKIVSIQKQLNTENPDLGDQEHLNDSEVKKALAAYFFSLDRNVEKVDDFYNKQYQEYEKRLKKLSHVVKASINNLGDLDKEELEEIIGVLVELRSLFRNLKWFGELNKRGFVKILKKLDKKVGTKQQESYLISRIYPLSFANESDILNNLNIINDYLNKISPHVKPQINGKNSDKHEGSAQPDRYQKYIQNDDDEGLLDQLITQYRSIVLCPVRLLISLLNRSALHESFQCVTKILEVIPSLNDPSDISARNFFHHHVITLGKQVKQKEERLQLIQREQSIDDFDGINLRPASPPVSNQRLINSFGSDGINSNDSPTALLFILKNLPPHLRPTLLQKDNYKRTPLHYSSQYGLREITTIIIEFLKSWGEWDETISIDNLKCWGDAESLSPLHLAVLGTHAKTVQVLVQNSNYTLTSSKILLLAARLNSPQMVEILLKCKGIDINYSDDDLNNETALYIASKMNFKETVEFLLSKGAETEITESSFGWTPLFIAAVEGLYDVVTILKKYDANCSIVDESGWTPMEHACLRGHLRIADELRPPKSLYDQLVKNKMNGGTGYNSSANSSNSSVNERPSLISQSSIEKVQQQKSSVKQDLFKALKPRVESPPVSPPKPVKSFGHRFLESNESYIIITLGSNDTREEADVIKLDRVPISKVHSTELDTALSLVVTKKKKFTKFHVNDDEDDDDDEYQPTVVDLPLDDVDPITIRTKNTNPRDEVIFFDIVPTYGGQHKQQKILGRAVAILDKIYTKVGDHRASLNKLVTLPIIETETLDLLGTINVEVLIVTPFVHPNLNLNKTETYWKSLVSTRVIGHRGLGKNNNNRNSLQLGENTVESFIAAASLGASYVEFDVQLTKDHEPVVYHDFLVAESGVDIPMHNLTLEQFLSLNEHPAEGYDSNGRKAKDDTFIRPRSASHLTRYDDDSTSNRQMDHFTTKMKLTKTFKTKGFKGNSRGNSIASSFVTLKKLFKKIPNNVGFNIECKYPLLYEAQDDDIGEVTVDLNYWVDTVLKVVFDNLNGRDVIFSSFHPEACLLLSLKQPTIPILFLTESGTNFMPDWRCSSLQSAIRFSKKWNLLGIVSAAEPIVKCPRLASVVKSSGLVCFTYGVENNEVANSKLQMESGVDAVIVDNVLAVRKGLTKDATGVKKEDNTIDLDETLELEDLAISDSRD